MGYKIITASIHAFVLINSKPPTGCQKKNASRPSNFHTPQNTSKAIISNPNPSFLNTLSFKILDYQEPRKIYPFLDYIDAEVTSFSVTNNPALYLVNLTPTRRRFKAFEFEQWNRKTSKYGTRESTCLGKNKISLWQ